MVSTGARSGPDTGTMGRRSKLPVPSGLARPSPSGRPRTTPRTPPPSADRPGARDPRGTRARRSAPSPARRCRRGAPPARRPPRRRCRWCRRRGRTPGEPNAQTSRTPPHGSRPPPSTWSRKIQRLPASRTASTTARPVAMWSAWLRFAPPQVSRKLPVMTISGRCRRTDAVITSRRATPYSSTPSGWPRNSTASTPTTSADRRCSSSRTWRHSSGSMPSMPASPLVTMQ